VTINTESIMECDAVQSTINAATFRINVLPATVGSKACVSAISHEDTSSKTPAVAVEREAELTTAACRTVSVCCSNVHVLINRWQLHRLNDKRGVP